jgi:hypothetical protein
LDEAPESRETEVLDVRFSASSLALIALCGTCMMRRVNVSRAAALPLMSLAGMCGRFANSTFLSGEKGRGLCAESQTMPMVAYVDDSGSEPSQPIYVLGGLILPDSTWSIFSADWDHVLRSVPKIEYFKGSEVWDRRKGQFMNFTTQERMDKVNALADLIFEYKPLAIACRLEWSVFEKFHKENKLIEELDDPYFFLFFAIIARMVMVAHEVPKFGKVKFMFDNQNQIGDRVQLWYNIFLSRCAPTVLNLLNDDWPDFDDEQKVMPLQGADMFAWYRRRSVMGNLGHESHQKLWSRFEPICDSIILDEQHLVKIATDLSALASFY